MHAYIILYTRWYAFQELQQSFFYFKKKCMKCEKYEPRAYSERGSKRKRERKRERECGIEKNRARSDLKRRGSSPHSWRTHNIGIYHNNNNNNTIIKAGDFDSGGTGNACLRRTNCSSSNAVNVLYTIL